MKLFESEERGTRYANVKSLLTPVRCAHSSRKIKLKKKPRASRFNLCDFVSSLGAFALEAFCFGFRFFAFRAPRSGFRVPGFTMKTIMHIDMNAFFAAVEQQSNPALRGRPIAVTGSEKRSIVLTASYEARAFGVKTGMTRFEACQLCPHLILVPANNRLYTHMSTEIMALLQDYSAAGRDLFHRRSVSRPWRLPSPVRQRRAHRLPDQVAHQGPFRHHLLGRHRTEQAAG